MNKYIKFLIIFIVLAFYSLPSLALEDAKNVKKPLFSIDECVRYAIDNSPNVKVAKQKVLVQKSKVGQAKSDYFPTLGAGTGYNFSSNKTKNISNLNVNSYNVDVSVNQLIWNFGKSTAKINMQKYNYQSSQYDLSYQILKTVYETKIAYFAVLAAKSYADVSKQTVRINKLNYERTNALFQEGLKSKIDVVNSEVYYTDAQIQLLEAEHAYEAALIDLANAMYYTDTVDFSVLNTENFNLKPVHYTPRKFDTKKMKNLKNGDETDSILTSGIEKHNILADFDFKPYTITVSEALDTAYKNRPDLKSLELVEKASEESLKAIKRSYYPEITAGAGYGYTQADDVYANSFKVSAGLDFPLINGMYIKTQIDEGKALQAIAQENITLSKKNIFYEVNNYYIAMKQLEKKIPLMAKKVQETLENFELADGRYTVGLGNFIELQQAQTNYNNAQLEFVQVVFKYNVAREEFLKSMGVQ